MTRVLSVLFACIGLVQLASTLPASAQVRVVDDWDGRASALPSAAAPPGYEAAIDQALAEFERGEFSAAREEFLRAHKMFPNARTLRALGKVEYELRSYVDAETHLALSLASQVRPLTGAQRVETEQLREHARRHVARYTFVTEPASAELTLDGSVPPLDARRSVRLNEGEYQLEARADGFLPAQRSLMVEGGVDGSIVLALTPAPSEALIASGPATHPNAEAASGRSKWWLWSGLAVLVVAGAVTGTVLALREPGQAHATGGSTGIVIPLGRTHAATY